MSGKITVALSIDFFKSFGALPHGIQGKVSNFILKFQQNPELPGINYEKIREAFDGNLRSVRIDQNYECIVLKPDKGNIYMLLWIDSHDNAYNWAKRHKCRINSRTGSVQVYEIIYKEHIEEREKKKGLFDSIDDSDLMRLGVPEDLISSVREVYTEEDLDRLEDILPSEAYEALFMMAAGDSMDQVLAERDAQSQETFDTEDFETAIHRLDSVSRFIVVDNETELATALNSSLKLWRIFLHPSQLRLVRGNKSGPVRVLGGAGTGKTVVAMHRAKWLARNYVKKDERILFTTFTRNLAVDIENNLRELCSPEEFKKIDVINFDGMVSKYLKTKNYEYKIIYESIEGLWQIALSLAPSELNLNESFYMDEWQKIIQVYGIETLEQYKAVSRTGRGTSLRRADRVKIWPVFEEYRSQLLRAKKKEIDDACRDACSLIIYDLEKNRARLPYKCIIVDEAQDMGTQAFKLIRTMVLENENDLFIVGDGHQRIYGRNRVILSRCGINIRGRSRKLRINYRTTEEIRSRAVALLEGFLIDDLDGGTDTQKNYKSLTHGEIPEILSFNTFEEQCNYIKILIKDEKERGTVPSHICISARTNQEIDSIQKYLEQENITVFKIRRDAPDSLETKDVRVATLHRVKGLEFDIMIVASANKGMIPYEYQREFADELQRLQYEIEERALLYVGITRARKRAIITSYGEPSRFLK